MKYIILILAIAVSGAGYGQAELQPWGSLSGIRVEGQLMPLGTDIRVLGKAGEVMRVTAKERQRPHYIRQGNTQIVQTNLDSLYIIETVQDEDQGRAKINVTLMAKADIDMGGAWFSIGLPADASVNTGDRTIGLSGPGGQYKWLLIMDKPLQTITTMGRLNIPIRQGVMHTGEFAHFQLSVSVSGQTDHEPLHLSLNTAVEGRPFDGFGGNFRLQNAAMDPQVIDYCLTNMRVAWARVEMPWMLWQPVKDSNPIDSARAGRLHSRVKAAMEMAQRLSKMGVPLILSAWFPPRWAIVGPPAGPRPGGAWGNPLNQDSMSLIYKSIADYIEYLREGYGVEIKLFSFNESDLGINVRQTGEEHDALIKGLGAYMAARGLTTKMLLGDNSDATTWRFIGPAMADPGARPYIGAISFHSWRGWDRETLEHWAAAAQKMDLPLIVGEGSIDAAAWNYPAIFSEPTYAMEEIDLYIRLLAICQPVSILQWQLTSDYSPLVGGGLFGNKAPLAPTQRFWNLKQLSSTPAGAKAMSITSDRAAVTCAALGDNVKKLYSIHLVNNGASRATVLKGLPADLKSLRVFVTDKQRGMKELDPVAVSDGEAHFTLDAWSYTELLSNAYTAKVASQ